jgi:hypothetical protein
MAGVIIQEDNTNANKTLATLLISFSSKVDGGVTNIARFSRIGPIEWKE